MLKVDGLSYKKLFQNISFNLPQGTHASLIGPSGSGKSTLLRIIAGLLPPTQGSMIHASNNIGMLFQRNALFDSLTVEENLLFPLRERCRMVGQKARAKASAALEAVDLAGTEENYPYELSGGMQKRLSIARALIVHPDLLLADEPTAGLDPITSDTIGCLLDRLVSEHGTTLLTVSSDMQQALRGSSIFFLDQGTFLKTNTTEICSHHALKCFFYGLSL